MINRITNELYHLTSIVFIDGLGEFKAGDNLVDIIDIKRQGDDVRANLTLYIWKHGGNDVINILTKARTNDKISYTDGSVWALDGDFYKKNIEIYFNLTETASTNNGSATIKVVVEQKNI